ncbi:group 1 truncated hemoglobin [Blastomonas sp. AAP53]|uniref:group I truncated hemoglobin n=1 Tax=Blastomonas sp. AAP53 TaxID=1248760 RepID=UPI0003028885|nr:group 1 truncated hemoglobin [Blastomonas sp. AAP53]
MISLILALAFAGMQDMPDTDSAQAVSEAAPEQPAPEPQRDPVTGELPVDPYEMSDAHAGATPFAGTGMRDAFHGQDGIRRVVNTMVDRATNDPRISEIFVSHDLVRLRRTLFEQFCYILNAGCTYTGRDMASSHRDIGLQIDDLNILVENLQAAMAQEKISFSAQNRFLSKLAPMKRDVVTR